MKKLLLKLSVIFFTFVILNSCSSQKKLVEQKLPLKSEFVNSPKGTIRGWAERKSSNQAMAIDKAKAAAISDLSASISIVAKGAWDEYRQDREVAKKTEFIDRANSRLEGVFDNLVSGHKVVDIKVFYDKKNEEYVAYALVEISKEDIDKKIEKTISEDEKLKSDFEFDKFKEKSDKQLEDFKNNRNY